MSLLFAWTAIHRPDCKIVASRVAASVRIANRSYQKYPLLGKSCVLKGDNRFR
jgi:hypothetical protein